MDLLMSALDAGCGKAKRRLCSMFTARAHVFLLLTILKILTCIVINSMSHAKLNYVLLSI